MDRSLGELLDELPEETAVLVVSDHGMHAHNRDGVFDADNPPKRVSSGHHEDAPPGIFIAAGYPFRSLPDDGESLTGNDLPLVGSVFDIFPTLMAMTGVPVASDLSGHVLVDLLEPSFLSRYPVRTCEPYGFDHWIARRSGRGHESSVEQERLEQLRSLGYVD